MNASYAYGLERRRHIMPRASTVTSAGRTAMCAWHCAAAADDAKGSHSTHTIDFGGKPLSQQASKATQPVKRKILNSFKEYLEYRGGRTCGHFQGPILGQGIPMYFKSKMDYATVRNIELPPNSSSRAEDFALGSISHHHLQTQGLKHSTIYVLYFNRDIILLSLESVKTKEAFQFRSVLLLMRMHGGSSCEF